MIYFCFVESSPTGVQHMQPLDAECVEDAREEAVRLLRQHASAYAAHVYWENLHLTTIRSHDIASS